MIVDNIITNITINLAFTNLFTVTVDYVEKHDDGHEVAGGRIILTDDDAKEFVENRCELGYERDQDGKVVGPMPSHGWMKAYILTKSDVPSKEVVERVAAAQAAKEVERKAKLGAQAAQAERESAEAIAAAKQAEVAVAEAQLNEKATAAAALEKRIEALKTDAAKHEAEGRARVEAERARVEAEATAAAERAATQKAEAEVIAAAVTKARIETEARIAAEAEKIRVETEAAKPVSQ